MRKLYTLLIFDTILLVSNAQCTLLPNAVPGITLTYVSARGTNASGVAYHPVNGQRVDLSWDLQSGEPMGSIIIERSENGIDFSSFHTVAYTGNGLYQAEDLAFPSEPYVYYRLRLTNKTGEVAYSQMRAVTIGRTPLETAQIYPNPSGGHCILESMVTNNSFPKITIFSPDGEIVFELPSNFCENGMVQQDTEL